MVAMSQQSLVQSLLAICITAVALAGGVPGEPSEECADMNTWSEGRNNRGRTPNAADHPVRFLLLTRRNQSCARLISPVNLSATDLSLFNLNLPIKLVLHGFRVTGSKPDWAMDLGKALLRVEDVNVVMVDWVYTASFTYPVAVENHREVSLQVSVLINQLQKRGSKLESFHLIGVSLGAHVAGFVGTIFGSKIGRITALDPAGPLFKNADTSDRLDPSDALFVEAIHTDADNLGISIPVGHVDFFPNGGKDQAGCASSGLYNYVICDHMRALHLYMSALNASCPLTGIPCYGYEDFRAGRCVTCDGVFSGTCPTIGLSKNSGITVSPLPKEQKVYLLTTAEPPYCAHHILVELTVSPLERSAELEVTLRTGTQETQQRLKLETSSTVHSRVLSHPAARCEISSIQLKNTGNRFFRQGNVHVASVCISEIPGRSEEPLCVNNINVQRGAPWSHDYVQLCDGL